MQNVCFRKDQVTHAAKSEIYKIATLCATKMCRFTGEKISSMVTEVCTSILKNMKG